MTKTPLLLFLILACLPTGAMAVETGKTAAMKYFTKKSKRQVVTRAPARASTSGALVGDQILAVAVGSLVNTQSYNWAEESTPGWNVEAFYQRAGDGYFGHGYHLDLQKFASGNEELTKLSFLFSLTFPRRLSFPVYIGVAAGPGYFLKQKENESHFAFDYKGYVGLRLNQVHSQYFVQSGVKNHVHVLSDGQFIGWFVSSGVAYTF